MTYIDALEWIDDAFDPSDYEAYDDYLQDIRDEFQNDNLIDAIQQELQDRF